MYLGCGDTERIVEEIREHMRHEAEVWRTVQETREVWWEWISQRGDRLLSRLGQALVSVGQHLRTRAASTVVGEG